MTAPALPPEVPVIGVVSSPNSAWRGGMKHTVVMDGTSLASSCDRESAQFAVEIARLAIARALGGDGEPVRWAVARRDGTLNGPAEDNEHAAWARVTRLNAETGAHAALVVKNQPYRVVPLFTRPAATGDTGEGGA